MSNDVEHELRDCAGWLEARVGLQMRPPSAEDESRADAQGQPVPTRRGWGVRGVVLICCLAATVAGLGIIASGDRGHRISSVVNTSADEVSVTATSDLGSVVIPSKVGAGDDRDPIQRFIGVPADPTKAAQWARTADTQAFEECMALEAPGQSLDRADAVTPEKTHCERAAAARVNLLPAMQDEYASLEAQVRGDPKAIRSAAALLECQSAAGFNPSTAPAGAVDPCAGEQRANSAVLVALFEQYAPAWIIEHRQELEALRDDIASLVEAAGNR